MARRFNIRNGTTRWGFALVLDRNGRTTPLTNPPIEEIGDTAPAVSPDGRTLVFSRVSPDFYNVTLWLLHLGVGYKPLGKEEKVQTGNVTNKGAAWLPDGKEFVFSSGAGTASGFGGLRYPAARFPRKSTLM